MDAGVTVAAYEKVTVRAGQFDAFRIEAKGKGGQQGAAGAGRGSSLKHPGMHPRPAPSSSRCTGTP